MNPSNIYNNDFDLCSLIKVLDSISYESKLGKNLKNTLRKFDKEELFKELEDCAEYYYDNNKLLYGYTYRIKSLQSIKMKYDRYYPSKEVKSCFNDVLGIRVLVGSLDLLFLQLDKHMTNTSSKLLHLADLRLGKKVDDGYRALHLYYQKSNIHYPIEVQFWNKVDYNFHNWTHKYSYKYKDSRYGKVMRELFSKGVIKSEEDYLKYLSKLEEKFNGICSS